MSKITTLAVYHGGINISPDTEPFIVSFPEEALKFKDAQLALAKHITKVTSADEQAAALTVAGELKATVRMVKDDGLALRKPLNDGSAEIIAKERGFYGDIEAEAKRIEGLVGGYQKQVREEQERIRREEEQKRQDAIRAQQAEQERLAKIERDRIAAEQAALNAKTKKARDAANQQAEALRQQEAQAQIDASEAQEDLNAALSAPSQVIDTTAAGASVSDGYEIEVTDKHALYMAHRQCCTIEPRLNAIKDLIRAGIKDIPGVKIIPRIKVAARVSTNVKPLLN